MTSPRSVLVALTLAGAPLFLAACGSSVTPESQLSEISKLLSKKYPMTKEQERDITAFTDAGKIDAGGKKSLGLG